MFDFLGDLYALGKIGLGMSSAVAAISESRKNENFYEQQARVNADRAEFNSRVALETGERQVEAILQQTKDNYSAQMVYFGKSGLDYRLGSSQELVATESISRGMQAAQQAMYDAEIRAINEEYKGMTAVHASQQNQRQAKFQTKQGQANLVDDIFKLGETASSWGASNKTSSSPEGSRNTMLSMLRATQEEGKV